jgi:hypothetical protein
MDMSTELSPNHRQDNTFLTNALVSYRDVMAGSSQAIHRQIVANGLRREIHDV